MSLLSSLNTNVTSVISLVCFQNDEGDNEPHLSQIFFSGGTTIRFCSALRVKITCRLCFCIIFHEQRKPEGFVSALMKIDSKKILFLPAFLVLCYLPLLFMC